MNRKEQTPERLEEVEMVAGITCFTENTFGAKYLVTGHYTTHVIYIEILLLNR